MLDIKVVKLLNAARIRKVDYLTADEARAYFSVPITEKAPVVFSIEGDNFDRAEQVLYNGEAITFFVRNSSLIHAIVPDNLVGRRVRNIFVLTNSREFNSSAIFSYEFGSSIGTVAGPEKLIQQFLLLLQKTPGSGVFNRSAGGGLQKFAGSVQKAPGQTLASISQKILNTAEQLKESQAGADLPPDERMRAVLINNITFTKGDNTSVEVALKVVTYGGSGLPVNLTLGAKAVIEQTLESFG